MRIAHPIEMLLQHMFPPPQLLASWKMLVVIIVLDLHQGDELLAMVDGHVDRAETLRQAMEVIEGSIMLLLLLAIAIAIAVQLLQGGFDHICICWIHWLRSVLDHRRERWQVLLDELLTRGDRR